MFDQKDVEAYRRIKAPEELREQVMRLEQKPEPTRTRTKWISFGSLAAGRLRSRPVYCRSPSLCCAWGNRPLVSGRTHWGGTGLHSGGPSSNDIRTSGSLRRNSSGAGNRRNDPGICFRLVELQPVCIPEGELLGDGTEAEISEDVLLYWDLSGTEDTMFSLTLKTNGKQLTYVLSMRDDGGYDLQQNQSPK